MGSPGEVRLSPKRTLTYCCQREPTPAPEQKLNGSEAPIITEHPPQFTSGQNSSIKQPQSIKDQIKLVKVQTGKNSDQMDLCMTYKQCEAGVFYVIKLDFMRTMRSTKYLVLISDYEETKAEVQWDINQL